MKESEKQNKIFTMALVVIVGVFLGVTIVAKKAKGPVVDQILQQQADTVRILNQLDEKLSKGGGAGLTEGAGDVATNLTTIYNSLTDLQRRVTALELKGGAGGGLPPELIRAFQNQPGGPGAKGSPGGQIPQGPPPEDLSKVHNIPANHTPIKGNLDAPITIVEFVDFQCPFCSRFHPVVNEVMAEYPGKVNYMLKNFPLSFHPEARPAAKAAFAAGEQGKYWEMVDLLLSGRAALSTEQYKKFAEELGLNVDKFESDIKDKDSQWEEWIQADMQLGGSVQVQGTPTFYLNGKKTTARTLGDFKEEIGPILNGGS